MCLRLYLKKREVERAAHLFRRGYALLRQTFCDVTDERAVKVIFEVGVPHAGNDRECVPDAALRHEHEEFVELLIVRLGLEPKKVSNRLMLGHDDCLVQNFDGWNIRILRDFTLCDSLGIELVGRYIKRFFLFTHSLAQIDELFLGRCEFICSRNARPLNRERRHGRKYTVRYYCDMKVILCMAMTVNGFIAKETDETSFTTEAEWTAFRSRVQEAGNMIIGRRTYDVMLANNEFKGLENVLTIVVTHGTSNIAPLENVIVVDSPRAALDTVREKNMDVALLAGGGAINGSFMKEGLVDEIYLGVAPLALGKGITLFGNTDFEAKLDFIELIQLTPEEVQLHYKVIK